MTSLGIAEEEYQTVAEQLNQLNSELTSLEGEMDNIKAHGHRAECQLLNK